MSDDVYELDPETELCFHILGRLMRDVILKAWTSAEANCDQLASALKDAEAANVDR